MDSGVHHALSGGEEDQQECQTVLGGNTGGLCGSDSTPQELNEVKKYRKVETEGNQDYFFDVTVATEKPQRKQYFLMWSKWNWVASMMVG